MKKFYEVNVHNICERIMDSICNSRELLLTEDELFALATKMLWIEQDYANIRALNSVKVRNEESYKNYRTKRGKSNIDRILDRAEERAMRRMQLLS